MQKLRNGLLFLFIFNNQQKDTECQKKCCYSQRKPMFQLASLSNRKFRKKKTDFGRFLAIWRGGAEEGRVHRHFNDTKNR